MLGRMSGFNFMTQSRIVIVIVNKNTLQKTRGRKRKETLSSVIYSMRSECQRYGTPEKPVVYEKL